MQTNILLFVLCRFWIGCYNTCQIVPRSLIWRNLCRIVPLLKSSICHTTGILILNKPHIYLCNWSLYFKQKCFLSNNKLFFYFFVVVLSFYCHVVVIHFQIIHFLLFSVTNSYIIVIALVCPSSELYIFHSCTRQLEE